jgi:hypothetical protein
MVLPRLGSDRTRSTKATGKVCGISVGDGTVVLLLADPTPISSTSNEGSTPTDLAQRSIFADELLPHQKMDGI